MVRTLQISAALAIAAVYAQCPPGGPSTAKLNVHVSPHTHDDVGWDETYMQYYSGTGPIHGRNVSQIIYAVVEGLLANPKRKFTYVEQAFFQVWYETQTPAMQATVQQLVASGQLTFVNGGWSMHDEANPTYVDMLDNTAVGQRNILDNFGVSALPTVTWQIDPFGHSAFQGVMSGPTAGYKGLMWGREPADFKQTMCAKKGVERVWTPSNSLGAAAATMQAVFVDAGYQSPFEVHRCDYPSKEANCAASFAASDLASLISDIDTYRAPNIRGNDILLNFGDDFTWENAGDYFSYLDALIEALNNDKSGRFTAFYSNPAQYLTAKLASVPSFPAIVGDFFPYNDDSQGHNMWAGYFTSRPALKGFVRESGAYMQSARQLQALTGGPADLGPSNPLFKLERAMGVTQHHDAVAGTEQQNVAYDYALILEGGRQDAYASIAQSFAKATGYGSPFSVCALTNVTVCPALEAGQPTVVLVYNALGQAQGNATVRLSAGFPSGVASYAVYDADANAVTAQIIPQSVRDSELRALYQGNAAVPVQWLAFTAPLPAAGYSAFFLVPKPNAAEAPSTFASNVAPMSSNSAIINNGRLTLTVSAATGFLSNYADAATGVSIALSQSWLSYIGAAGQKFNGSSQSSGAYIFRPDQSEAATPLQSNAATVTLVTGPVVNMFLSDYGYVTQETRLWAGATAAEVEWTVGPVDVSDKNGHEVITRYDGGFDSTGDWTTDSNCRESQLRRRNWRANWNVTITEPVAGNYYPVNCLIKTTSTAGVTLAVAVDRSEGSSSLRNGQLEIMVHRRLLHDDGRGVGEALSEPGLDGKGLIIRGRHWIAATPSTSAPAVYKALQQQGLALPTTVTAYASLGALAPAQWTAQYTASASLLTAPLPANVHLATVHPQGPKTILLRLAHLYETGEDVVLSQNATVSLASLFKGQTVTAAQEMTLIGTQPLASVPQQTYVTDGGASYTVPILPAPPAGAAMTITLGPMQIRTFMLTMA